MSSNSTLQDLNKSKDLYTKYILNSKIIPIIFSAANVNIFVYVFWTIIYYTIYYGYTVNKINKNIENITSSNETNTGTNETNTGSNETNTGTNETNTGTNETNTGTKENKIGGANETNTGAKFNKNKSLVESYAKFTTRFFPFLFFIIVVIILQYVMNVFYMKDKCGSESFINFTILSLYTIGVWFVVLLSTFAFLYKMPKLKNVYANSLLHDLFNKFVTPSKETIFESLFKKNDEIKNPKLKELIKDINCNFMKSKTKEIMNDEEFKKYCKDKKKVLFLNSINISNYNEYFILMEPIINKNGKENEFLKFIIKRDILSEMLWVIKVGLLVVVFIYTKLKDTKCLNHKKKYEENVKEFIDSKMKKCAVEDEEEEEEESKA